MNNLEAFQNSLFDSYMIKLSKSRAQRLGDLIFDFPHRPKERIPYMAKRFADDIIEESGSIIAEKLDGALSNIFVRNNGDSGANSHRISKKTDKPIDYTSKIEEVKTTTLPEEFRTDNMDLKGEIILVDKKGRALPHQEISGFLNSKPENARKKLENNGWTPKIGIFDIWDDDRPYKEKVKDLRRIAEENPHIFFVPKMAYTKSQKKKLIEDIKTGKNPRTSEGIIWEGKKKLKFPRRAPVYVQGLYEASPGSKYEGKAIGGFQYSHSPGGPTVGHVGSGFTDKIRRDMYNNPHKYIGRKVTIEHQGQYNRTGAYRGPAFKGVS